MKVLQLLFVSGFLCSCLYAADQNDASGSSPPLQSHEITLIEFQLKDAQSLLLSKDNIAENFDQLTADGRIEIIETVQLYAVTGYKAKVLFGRQISVVQGLTHGPHGETRSMKEVALGTGVAAMIAPKDDKLVLSLEYQSSRVFGEIPQDSPPEIATLQIDTSLVLGNAERTVLCGTTSQNLTFVMVMVKEN